MIWRLFRPRPVLKITIPGEPISGIKDMFDKEVKKEYILLIEFDSTIKQMKVEIVR